MQYSLNKRDSFQSWSSLKEMLFSSDFILKLNTLYTSFLSASVASCFLAVHCQPHGLKCLLKVPAWKGQTGQNSRGLCGRVPNVCILWGVPQMGVPQNGWFIRENPFKMHDFGGRGALISGNLHILRGSYGTVERIASNITSNSSYFFIAWPKI